jgi:hypothetical protein
MMPISAEVLAALPQAIGRPYYAEWSNDGGTSWSRCGLVAGSASITADRTAETRYTGQAEVTGVAQGRDGINSVSTNVRLWQGIVLPRRDPVWVAAGRYSVTRTSAARTGGISLELDGLAASSLWARCQLWLTRSCGPSPAAWAAPSYSRTRSRAAKASRTYGW